MKYKTAPPGGAASSCMSPVKTWQILLAYLLERHYGLTMTDTPFHYDRVINEHIDAGIKLVDALNFLVERYGLIRIDRRGFSWLKQSPFLTTLEVLNARCATGLKVVYIKPDIMEGRV